MRKKKVIFEQDRASQTQEVRKQSTEESIQNPKFGDEIITSPKTAKKLMSEEEYTQAQKKAYEQGIEEAFRQRAREEVTHRNPYKLGKEEGLRSEAREKINLLSKEAQQKFLEIKTVFPFDLFPDTLSIDATKINIVSRVFFASESTKSIEINEVADVIVESIPFLATLKIQCARGPVVIHYLKPSEAKKAKRIIQGLLIAKRQGIDISRLDISDKMQQVEELGKSAAGA